MTRIITLLTISLMLPFALIARGPNVGERIPNALVKTPSGSEISLHKALTGKPTVLIFYRGSWCPYCNKHLMELAGIESELTSLGYQIVALSPDSPENISTQSSDASLPYELYSDNSAAAAKAFDLAFTVDAKTREKYKNYGIDLKEASGGKTHYLLPIPAAFIVNEKGVIQFRYVNEDYKTRVSGKALLEKARELRN